MKLNGGRIKDNGPTRQGQETKSEPEPKGLVFQLGQSTELANSEGKKPDEVIQRSNLTIVTHSPQIDEEDKEENQVTILPDSPDTPAYSDARSNWEGETPQKPPQKDYKIIAEYQAENIQSEIEKSILSIVSNIEDGSIIIEEHTLEKNPPGPSEVEKTAGGGDTVLEERANYTKSQTSDDGSHISYITDSRDNEFIVPKTPGKGPRMRRSCRIVTEEQEKINQEKKRKRKMSPEEKENKTLNREERLKREKGRKKNAPVGTTTNPNF
ncbi:hypothetical protein JTB14_025250 [Gonioctena quinquepunctata]|nr:hypothetical protein JTB14_025250 [Gonioctena quinquepunctata]